MTVRCLVVSVLVGLLMVTTVLAPVTVAVTADAFPATDAACADLSFMNYIHINGMKFDPLQGLPRMPLGLEYVPSSDSASYYIVQLRGPVTAAMRESVQDAGASLLHYISYNAYVVRADQATLHRLKSIQAVRWIGEFEPAYKVSERLSPEHDAVLEAALERAMSATTTYASSSIAFSSSPQAKAVDPYTGAAVDSYLASDRAALKRAHEMISAVVRGPFIEVEIVAFEKAQVFSVAEGLEKLGAKDIRYSFETSGKLRARVDRALIPEIAKMSGVMWIDRYVQPFVYNDIARWVIQSNDDFSYSAPIHEHGIWGTNQTITVCDSGLDYEHNAFEDVYGNNTPNPSHRKVTDYYVPPGGGGDYSDNGINHGTHVSGTVAGDDGTWHVYDGDPWGSTGSLGPHDGHAFDAKIQMQDLSPDGYYVYPPDDYAVLYQNALDRGSYIHTNSWGGPEYYYVQECADTDQFVWTNQDFTILFAAGNPGSGLGWISSYASAKNVIGVGATLNGASREDVASFSGRGPCSDGRLKPDVMAPGVNTWSARGGDPGGVYDDYFQLSGTSMATPACAGAVTLIRQYYMDGWYPTGSRQPTNGFVPSAALIKATLINSAIEMSGSGAYINGETRYPNYNQGWGRVVLDDALYFEGETRGLVVDDNRAGLNTGQSSSYSLAVGDDTTPVEITLVWTDYPGTPMSTPNLVNDLDLTVIAPDGTVYRGNMYQGYNPGESIPNSYDNDHINNVESVLVLSPQPGLWTVIVDAFNVPWGPQSYAIVMTGGIATERGTISLDSERYRSNATVWISVVDTSLDVNPYSADSANVTIWSDTEPGGEAVVLWETAPSSSVFMGFIPLEGSGSPVPDDGYLQTKHGDMITAAYYDEDDGRGGSGYVYDHAEVDDMPPMIFDVRVVNLRFNRATIVWSTDEKSSSTVIWGTTAPPTNVKSDPRMVSNHTVSLTGLTGNTTYCFAVQSTDLAGSTATDDNGSLYYWFVTPERPELPGSSREWPMYHNNPARQGASPAVMAPPLQLMWSDGPNLLELWTSPVYSDGVLVSTTLDGAIRARDPYTGEVLWKRTLGGQYYYTCSPTVESGVVYASFYKNAPAGEEGRLYALDLYTGDTIWSIGPETGLDISARTALAHDSGLLFGCSWSGEIFAVDMMDGSVEWRYQTGDISIAGAAVGLGLVFVTLYNSYSIVAIDQYSGGLVWRSSLDDLSVGPALVAQDCVYVGTESGNMYCFDAATGVLQWLTSGLSPIDFGTPAYDGTNIYFGTLGGNVWALDASDGGIQWVTTAGSAIGSSLAYVDGYLYFACQDGLLYVVDSANGDIVQTHSIGTLSVSSPATAEGWVWVENYDGTIFGFLGKIPVGLVVAPIKQQKDVVPSSAADFNLTVRNIGVSGPDTFDISLTMGAMGWTVDLYEGDGVSPLTDTDGDGIVDTGPLATSETKTLIARMTIPLDADIGDEETSILTFSSSNDLAVTKSALITATVPPPGVWIGPRQFFPLRPGDIASATLEVRNKGAMPDTIDLTTSDVLAWPTALYESDGVTPLSDHDGDGIPDTDVIGGLGSSTIVVEVQVPIDAEMGSVNRVTVTGTSSLDPNASGSRDIVIELAAPPNDEWPMFHNDVSRRGEWPGAMSPPLEMRWVDRNGTEVGVWYVSPAYADGMLFTTNADGYIRAHDAISGELIWARKIGVEYYYTTSPNVYDGMVITSFYTLTGAGTMFAFDEFTGETLWSFGPGSGFELAARTEKLVIDGLAFGTAWSGEIFALDAYTGALVWSTNVGMRPVGGLAAGAGALFCPTDEGYLVAIDQQTGAYLWSSPLDYTAAVTPVYGEGCVYVGTQMGTMYAIDAGTGDLVWRTGSLGSFWFSSPAYHTGLLYFGTDAARYYAMDASDGSIVWSTSGTDWVECGPVYSNGHLYFTEWDGQLRVLDAEDGSVVEIHYLEGYVECSPAAG
ncbi:MAG: PQQ-binding-like beta-propeller repeat protein, partial [Thermoplasmata archaeon]